MNIHPLFVHFPIALLCIYSLLELIRFKKVLSRGYLFYTKAILVILGTVGAVAALFTGSIAEDIYQGPLPQGIGYHIISIHAKFAAGATLVYGFIALFYFLGWLRREGFRLWPWLGAIEKGITERFWGVILAIIGGLFMVATGLLGGLIAYGPFNDPVSSFVYGLIIK